VSTPQGDFRVAIDDVRPGERALFLDGRVMVDGVVPAVQITSGGADNDFPDAATGPDGSLWVAYVAHTHRGPADLQPLVTAPESFTSLVPDGGGDQIVLARFDGQTWSTVGPISAAGLDVWRPVVSVDRFGVVHSVWSQDNEANWDIAQALRPTGSDPAGKSGRQFVPPAARVTSDPGVDASPVFAFDGGGRPWLAWQAWRGGRAGVWLRRLPAGPDPGGEPMRLTDSTANAWSPAIAADSTGRVHVAFDSYRGGNYDVHLCTIVAGKPSEPIAVAASSRFEARPNIVCDAKDRVWIAYEQRASDWGKDFGPLAPESGSPLYMRGSNVQVRCVADGKLMQPAGELMKNFPDDLRRYNSCPRLAFDGRGRLWLVFRHRHEAVWGGNPSAMMVGGVWLEYATCYAGAEWSPPILLAASDNLLDVRPALARVGTGDRSRLIAIYPSDARLRREAIGEDRQRKIFFTGGGVSVTGQVKNDLFAAVLPDLGPAKPMKLVAADATKPGPAGPAADTPAARNQGLTDPDPESKAIHPNFDADVKRIRDYRIEAGGKKYQLLRGEFHRHTEWSMDGGDDGSLEEPHTSRLRRRPARAPPAAH